MKRSILIASMGIAAGLALANIYTSIVDAPSWGSHLPESIEVARQYYQNSNPGNFFRIFSPANQALGLLCILLFWKRGNLVRSYLIAAFILYVIGEGMTFMYFYPRNEIMFQSNIIDVEQLKTTWQEWCSMNWVRTLVIVAGFICSARALHYSYLSQKGLSKKQRQSSAGKVKMVEQVQ